MQSVSENFDPHQFAGRYNQLHRPVQVDFIGGEIQSTGLDFRDYSYMHMQERKLAPGRQVAAPDWAMCDTKLRDVVVRALEIRAAFRKPQPGTPAERLARAQRELVTKQRSLLISILDGLCKRYMELKLERAHPHKRLLARKIEEADSALRLVDKAAVIYAGAVFHYYRRGLDSVAVAAALGIKPPAVRRTLWRMRRVAGELGFGPKVIVQHRPGTLAKAKHHKCRIDDESRSFFKGQTRHTHLNNRLQKDTGTGRSASVNVGLSFCELQ